MVAVLFVLGLGSVGAGTVLLAGELTRHATKAEAAAAAASEVASRWRRLTLGQIFPATVSYQSVEGTVTYAKLVGIASPASCQAALDESVARALSGSRCLTVLRATYVNSSRTLVTTIGVAVLGSPISATETTNHYNSSASGVRTVGFPGTIANAFGNQQRAAFGAVYPAPTYVLFYAAGFADGRSAKSAGSNVTPEFSLLGVGILTTIQNTLAEHRPACQMKDVQC